VADTADDLEGEGHTPPPSPRAADGANPGALESDPAAGTRPRTQEALTVGVTAAVGSAVVAPAATRVFWAFALLAPNAPTKAVRWNPCRTITWVWPGSNARDRYWMTRSMQAASVYSGLRFQQVGTKRADIVVRIAELASPTVGLGGARATLRRGVWRYEQGTITVDRGWRAKRPSDLKYFSLLQHELGHVIGLSHVNSLAELMYPSIHGQWKFGPGDKIGLRLLGRRSGCIL
jgi:hypothetical protein